MDAKIDNDWNFFLENEFKKEYFVNIKDKYYESKKKVNNINLRIFPKEEDIFRAFKLTSIKNIKIVIIGQDSYHSICPKTKIPYANGLAFSTQNGCLSIPKSLYNIFKELKNDLNIENKSNDLTKWAEQGVFLLNTQLSVVEKNPNSHKFWNTFTDNVINYISNNCKNIIFIIWGANSLKKCQFIDKNKHFLFISSHPSPLSAYKKLDKYDSFLGSKIFSKINNKLLELKKEQINWKI